MSGRHWSLKDCHVTEVFERKKRNKNLELCHEKVVISHDSCLIIVPWLSAPCCDWISLLSFSRNATLPLSTAAFLNMRVNLCVRPTTTSPVGACVRPASSQFWAVASLPWGPNSTPTILCVTSAWSPWAKAASRSRRTSPTATPASSNCLAEDIAGLFTPPLGPKVKNLCDSDFSIFCFFIVGKRVELVSFLVWRTSELLEGGGVKGDSSNSFLCI